MSEKVVEDIATSVIEDIPKILLHTPRLISIFGGTH